jgi:hypothetical protein
MSRGGFFSMMMRCALLLALIAVGQRTALPDGLMLQNTGAAGVEMVLCTGHGALAITLDADGHPVGQDHDKAPAPLGTDKACPFAMAAIGGAPPAPVSLAEPIRPSYVRLDLAPTRAAPALGMASPPPHTTGPPAIV